MRPKPPAALFAARPIATQNDPDPAAAVFRALGHPTRLRLVRELIAANGPVDSARLRYVTTQGVTAEHLKVLQAVGLVDSVGRGRHAAWQLVPGSLAKVRALLVVADDDALPLARGNV